MDTEQLKHYKRLCKDYDKLWFFVRYIFDGHEYDRSKIKSKRKGLGSRTKETKDIIITDELVNWFLEIKKEQGYK